MAVLRASGFAMRVVNLAVTLHKPVKSAGEHLDVWTAKR
jgi:hypothetical protein